MIIERTTTPPKPDQTLVPQSSIMPLVDPRQRILWLAMRQALLMVVDAIEIYLTLERTSELRKRKR